MKNEALYKKTCDILYDAYFNDTLRHGTCCACAVGNIVASNLNYEYDKCDDELYWKKRVSFWGSVFCTSPFGQSIKLDFYFGEAKKEIDSTGYSWQDLAKIEYAFESANNGKSIEEYNYNGLAAVIEVLNQIHEVEEDTQTERFTNHYNKRKQLA